MLTVVSKLAYRRLRLRATDRTCTRDLAYVLDDPASREQVVASMQQLQANTQVVISVTTVLVQDPYTTLSQNQVDTWLAQQPLGISIFLTADNRTKAFQRCEIQVSPAVEVLLSAQDLQQIQTDVMEYYFHSTPVPTDAYLYSRFGSRY